jgi:hypothetical protein
MKLDRKRFDSMVIITAWTLWKQRNARVFGNAREQKNPIQVLEAIREEFQLWEIARRGGSSQIAREWALGGWGVGEKCEWVLELMSVSIPIL